MPLFSDLRSDYPLYLTLLERRYAGALKQSCRAGLTSARGIPVPLIGSNLWFLPRLLADRAFDAQHYPGTNGRHYHSVEPTICTGSRTDFCSSARAPSTSESTCRLTHVRALVRAFRLNIDEQLAHLIEHWCASPRGNSGPYSYALTLSLLWPNSALYAVAAVHLLSTSGRPSPITTVPVRRFKCGTRGKECTSGLSLSGVPVRGQQGKSDQLKLDQLRRST
jgi:hypothetical protein